MTVSYKKLWKLLIDRDMRKKDLCAAAGISHASMAKLGKNENVTTDVLVKICTALQCDIGDIMENCEEQRKLLQLPEYVFPAVMIVFGWPTKQQMKRKKPERCEQKHIVHENTYRNMEGDELREMFAYKCKNSTYEEWCSAFCNRKYNSDFSKEMSKSVKEYLEQFR